MDGSSEAEKNILCPKKKFGKLHQAISGGLPLPTLSPTKAEGAVSPGRNPAAKILDPEQNSGFANEALDLSKKMANGHDSSTTHCSAAQWKTEEPENSTTAEVTTSLSEEVAGKRTATLDETAAPPKKKRKPAKKGKRKKPAKKKKTGRGSQLNLDLDPRLGGSKVSTALKSKGRGKSKHSKGVEPELKKFTEPRFPYVHIEGSWQNPRVVKIVNGPQKDDESERVQAAKPTKAAQYIDEEHRTKVAKIGFTSTLSDKYDAQNRDLSWVCTFCQHYTHVSLLGDLYGPYYVNRVEAEPLWHSRKNPDVPAETHDSHTHRSSSKRSRKTSGKKRTCSKSDTIESQPQPMNDLPSCSTVLNPDEKMEVWFHENCLVWAPGVLLIPPRLQGLDEAVADSLQAVCGQCSRRGANIFCRQRGCGQRAHYPCAASNHWSLDEENFVALCPAHKPTPS